MAHKLTANRATIGFGMQKKNENCKGKFSFKIPNFSNSFPVLIFCLQTLCDIFFHVINIHLKTNFEYYKIIIKNTNMTECNQDTHVMTEALDHFVVKHKFCSIERILNQ
jgi:hypothetical protein